MQQIVHSVIVYTQPYHTRFEWVNEVSETGIASYWLYLQTQGLDYGEPHAFTTEAERAAQTPELSALHHRDTCWPDWFGPLPRQEPLCLDVLCPLAAFDSSYFPVRGSGEDQRDW